MDNKKSLINFRGSNIESNYDELYQAKIYRYEKLSDIPWLTFQNDIDIPVRIIVWPKEEILPVDLLFIPRNSRQLLIGFHGAEARNQANLPKFQFVRSFTNERTESLLFFSDSTLLLNEKIALGWMTGNSQSHFLPRVVSTINSASNALDYTHTTLVGHSAGGFSAIAVGSYISNSVAVSINGQVVVGAHEIWTVKALQEAIYPEEYIYTSMLSRYCERMDLRFFLKNRVSNSSFNLYAHKDDPNMMTTCPHFPILTKFFGIGLEGGVTSNNDSMVLCDWERKNNVSPHALPGTVIPFIQLSLGEKTKLDVRVVTT